MKTTNLFYGKRLLTTRYEIEIFQKSVYEISLKRINLENGSGIVLDAVAVFFSIYWGAKEISKVFKWIVDDIKQGIAEADKILKDLDLDEDSEILAFLQLVSEEKATILNLTDEILAWIKAENLADKLYINF
ncbi:MAG: hypothetical protein UDG86_02550 [Lachnospiraceae bacterium]|nr:hypothetical protein [Lachnospiraceae bacterium]